MALAVPSGWDDARFYKLEEGDAVRDHARVVRPSLAFRPFIWLLAITMPSGYRFVYDLRT